MFNMDIFGNLEPLRIYLCSPSGEVFGEVDNIDETTASLKVCLNNQYDLTFDVIRDLSSTTPTLFDSLQDDMILVVEKIGQFIIKNTNINVTDAKEVKTITAYSIEHELEDKFLKIPINMGTENSSEYLVDFSDDPDEMVLNPYTNIPYDWIVVYNTFSEQLQDIANAGYFGALRNEDITINDAHIINEIEKLITLIPRLKNKFIKTISDGYTENLCVYNDDVIISCNNSISGDIIVPSHINGSEITSITGGAFHDCRAITSIIVPPTIKSIGNVAFTGCSNLRSVIIPSSVEYLMNDSFTSCNNLKDVYYCGSESQWIKFGVTLPESCTVHYNYDFDYNSITNYSLVEYVIINTGDDSKIKDITLTSKFRERVDYLVEFYKKYREQLSLISLVLGNTEGNWSVGDIYGVNNGDYSLANKKYQFEIDENDYSFLTQTFASASRCLVSFDLFNKRVNVIPVENIGKDTGIVLSYTNLLNSLDISYKDENLSTRLYVMGANDLGIEQVNFGLSYIDDLRYKMGLKNEYGKRLYVSDELANKYGRYFDYRESQRQTYIEKSKEYNQCNSDIYSIKYRVPNDMLHTEWDSYTQKELEETLTNYKNIRLALITLYKEDYSADLNEDGSVNETKIKDTEYWYDYFAYNNIINQIEAALTYRTENINYSDVTDEEALRQINAYKTEWSLYGTVELEKKISSYANNLKALVDGDSVILNNDGSAKEWSNLSKDEKALYNNSDINYYYDVYMDNYNNQKSAQSYLETLKEQIADIEAVMLNVQSERDAIVSKVTLKGYTGDDNVDETFTDKEIQIINSLYKDASYNNENVLTTSLNTTVDSVDVMLELLNIAKEELETVSRPQLEFSSNLDNLLAIITFKPMWTDFELGNHIQVEYKNDIYLLLRMVSFEFNPLLPYSNNLSIEFSNLVYSNGKLTDLEYLLGLSDGGSGGSSSSTGGGASENSASDDIDAIISDSMLTKLLNSETFGTRVSDVILDTIDVNALTARMATFGGLYNGTTTIDGKCITTGVIKSNNYDGESYDEQGNLIEYTLDNNNGTILRLDNGEFNFAYSEYDDGGEVDSYRKFVLSGNTLGFETAKTKILLSDVGLSQFTENTEDIDLGYIEIKSDKYIGSIEEQDNFFTKLGILFDGIETVFRSYETSVNELSKHDENGYMVSGVSPKNFNFESIETEDDLKYLYNSFSKSTLRHDGLFQMVAPSMEYHFTNADFNEQKALDENGNEILDESGNVFYELVSKSKLALSTYNIAGYANDLYICPKENSSGEIQSNLQTKEIKSYQGIPTELFSPIEGMTIDVLFESNQTYEGEESEEGKVSEVSLKLGDYTYPIANEGIWSLLYMWMEGQILTFKLHYDKEYQNFKWYIKSSSHTMEFGYYIEQLTSEVGDIYNQVNGEIIPEGADLNTYLEVGSYIGLNTSTVKYVNCPAKNCTFNLDVIPAGKDGQRKQIISECKKDESRTWERYCHNDANHIMSFGEWSCTYSKKNVLLWDGDVLETHGYYMTHEHTIELSENISTQPTGIVLTFAPFDKSAGEKGLALDYSFVHCFVPKEIVSLQNGKGSYFYLNQYKDGYPGAKYLYIYDEKIKGYSENGVGVTTSEYSGEKYNNSDWVLRYVFGV